MHKRHLATSGATHTHSSDRSRTSGASRPLKSDRNQPQRRASRPSIQRGCSGKPQLDRHLARRECTSLTEQDQVIGTALTERQRQLIQVGQPLIFIRNVLVGIQFIQQPQFIQVVENRPVVKGFR